MGGGLIGKERHQAIVLAGQVAGSCVGAWVSTTDPSGLPAP
jgi:hypothetical protein